MLTNLQPIAVNRPACAGVAGSEWATWLGRRWRRWILPLLLWVGWLAQTELPAVEITHIEAYQLKAALLPKLPLFVEWPELDSEGGAREIVIGIFGQNPFGTNLMADCQNRTVQGRALNVKLCHSLADAKTCQILFIGASEKTRLHEILAALANSNVLTVGDWPTFGESGGMIELVLDNRKIRIEINTAAVRKTSLRIDPQLLQMAQILPAKTSLPKSPK